MRKANKNLYLLKTQTQLKDKSSHEDKNVCAERENEKAKSGSKKR